MKAKKALIIAAGAIVLLIAVLIVVPYFVDINRFRPALTKILSDQLNADVEVSNLRFSLITGFSLIADGVTIRDPRLTDRTFVSASSLKINVALIPLLSKNLVVRSIALEQPVVTLIEYPDGTLNAAALGAPSETTTSPEGAGATPPGSTAAEGEGTFTIKSILVRSVRIKDGSFGYLTEKSTKDFVTHVDLHGVNLELDSISLADEPAASTDKSILSRLSADVTVDIDEGTIYSIPFTELHSELALQNEILTASDLASKIFGGKLLSDGVFHLGATSDGKITVSAKGVRMNELLDALSTEKNLMTGNLDLSGSISFPFTDFTSGLAGTGTVSITDGTIPDFSLRTELAKALGVPADLLPVRLDTEDFDYIGGDWRLGSERVSSEHFTVSGPVFSAVGSGFVGFNKALSFTGTITLNEAITDSGLLKLAAPYVNLSSGLKDFPFEVGGTLDHVTFSIPLTSRSLGTIEGIFKSFGIDLGK
jgi:uncharacterized protein involved in outer membrane biogenesis